MLGLTAQARLALKNARTEPAGGHGCGHARSRDHDAAVRGADTHAARRRAPHRHLELERSSCWTRAHSTSAVRAPRRARTSDAAPARGGFRCFWDGQRSPPGCSPQAMNTTRWLASPKKKRTYSRLTTTVSTVKPPVVACPRVGGRLSDDGFRNSGDNGGASGPEARPVRSIGRTN